MANSDSQSFSGITSTTSSFQLFGGRYWLNAVRGGGTWNLQVLLADGSTWFNVTGFSDGATEQDLGPGTYRFDLFSGPDTGTDITLVRF